GNFEPDGAINLLKRFRAITNVKTLVIGADLKKDTGRLVRAYDDAQGVTAAFNMNLLTRANREVGANFDLTAFRHLALYNEALGRIEMHLESTTAQTVSLLGQDFAFRQGETIHTENSHKFTVAEFQGIAAQAGWRASDVWTDDETLFSVHLFQNSDS
ncbi:MAG: L-histidine N(alpha)-methyltransferase, partial [Alphaproteobacteria bacterium]